MIPAEITITGNKCDSFVFDLMVDGFVRPTTVHISTSDVQTSQSTTAEQTLNTEVLPNSFATIQTTFDDTGTTIQVAEPQVLPPFQPLPDQSPTEMLSRMVDVLPFSWDTSTDFSDTTPAFSFDPFHILCSDPFLQSVLEKFYYFKADVEMHFRVNTNSFYGGALMVTTFPGTANSSYQNFVQARSWRPKIVLSAQKQDTVIVTMPWVRPERFITLSDILVGGLIPWKVNVDIIAPLVFSTTIESTTVNVNVSCRFVNARVTWPIHVASPSRPEYIIPDKLSRTKKTIEGSRFELQSGRQTGFTTTQMKQPAMPKTRALISSTIGGPAQTAASGGSQIAKTVESTVSDVVGTVVSPIAGIVQGLQPLLGIGAELGGLAALFDKPNNVDPPTRVVPVTGANMATCDQKDQSLPLTLYSTAYLSTDQRALPEGGPWTLARIAMTPTLHSRYQFKNDQRKVYIPYQAPGTPFSVLSATHKYWRGSVRYKLMFFCPSFVSARFLLVYTPTGITSADIITNTLSRVVDCRGDTSVEFTIPYVNQTDFQEFGADIGVVQVTLYSDIVGPDPTVDPVITMVVFSAAGPDCQFSQPTSVQDTGYDYPNIILDSRPAVRTPRRQPVERRIPEDMEYGERFQNAYKLQTDVDLAFRETMLPFVDGCKYMTDECLVRPETTRLATDIMKRYQSTTKNPNSSTVGERFYVAYLPNSGTCGAIFARMFMFWRGGIRFKTVVVQSGPAFSQPLGTIQGPPPATAFYLGGSAGFITGVANGGMDTSVPWPDLIPYKDIYTAPVDEISTYLLLPGDATTLFYTYTAVGDDYSVGMLVPPDNLPDDPRPSLLRHTPKKKSLPVRFRPPPSEKKASGLGS